LRRGALRVGLLAANDERLGMELDEEGMRAGGSDRLGCGWRGCGT
jgi:hypothetical protein